MSDDCYYVYYYLREISSDVAKQGTPYYVGLGKGNRINRKGKFEVKPPPSLKNRIKIADNLSFNQAKMIEILHIKLWGRVDNGTGILRNKTNGGDGTGGRIMPEHERKKRSLIQKEVQNRPDVISKRHDGNKRANLNPLTHYKRSHSAKQMSSTPEFKEKHTAAMLRYWANNLTAKSAASNRANEFWNNETRRKEKSAHTKALWEDDEFRRKRAESFSKTAQTDQFKKLKREVQLGLKFWNNGIINVRARECPLGFKPGRLKKIKSTS